MARKKRAAKTRKSRKSSSRLVNFRNKMPLVVKNLLLFIALSLVSLVLWRFVPNANIITDLFYIMAIAFGFVAVALLITLLVLWILKVVKK